MKTKMISIGVILAAIFCALFSGSTLFAGETAGMHRVFILHSYDRENVCGRPQHDGVVAALKEQGFTEGKNLVLKTYYMNTKSRNNTEKLISRQARIALSKIRDFRPHVLVTLDDNAFRTVALELVDTPRNIVFSGMNGQPEDYNLKKRFMESRERPGHNITGVYENLHFTTAVRVQKKILPDLRKVRMLWDLSPTGRAIDRQIQIELGKEKIPVGFDKKIVRSWEEYMREIETINNDPQIGAVYLAALLLKDAGGKAVTVPEIFRWTVQNCRKPAIAPNYAFVEMGLFGGAVIDYKAMGMQAGSMAAEILRGRKPGDLAIEDAGRYALVFNLARARQLGIAIPDDMLLAADEVITKIPE